MHDLILRILSLSKVTSQIPVCSHILSIIDWEKEKHSFALMAKAFSVLQKEKKTHVTSQLQFYPVVLSLKSVQKQNSCQAHQIESK